MEECTPEEQSLESLRVLRTVELFVIILVPSVEHHLLDIASGLHSHFDTLLQNRDREVRRGGSSQKEPEFAVDLL